MMKQIETQDVFFSIEDGILFCSYKAHLEIDIVTARRIIKNRIDFMDGQLYPILIDFSNMKSATKEARDYMNSSEGGLNGLLGGAFLSKSVVATLFINLYLKVNNPAIPARFFTNRDEAITWLKRIKLEKTQFA
ncbi:MAG TPA: hypothetical protein VK517_09775 [Cyclobacteriaceae bacterium]|nr:hypothetical protein [Cyclobacteriaceae bacterium]